MATKFYELQTGFIRTVDRTQMFDPPDDEFESSKFYSENMNRTTPQTNFLDDDSGNKTTAKTDPFEHGIYTKVPGLEAIFYDENGDKLYSSRNNIGIMERHVKNLSQDVPKELNGAVTVSAQEAFESRPWMNEITISKIVVTYHGRLVRVFQIPQNQWIKLFNNPGFYESQVFNLGFA